MKKILSETVASMHQGEVRPERKEAEAKPYLEKFGLLAEPAPKESDVIAKAVALLDSNRYREREIATRFLIAMGPRVMKEPAVLEGLKRSSPEQLRRLSTIEAKVLAATAPVFLGGNEFEDSLYVDSLLVRELFADDYWKAILGLDSLLAAVQWPRSRDLLLEALYKKFSVQAITFDTPKDEHTSSGYHLRLSIALSHFRKHVRNLILCDEEEGVRKIYLEVKRGREGLVIVRTRGEVVLSWTPRSFARKPDGTNPVPAYSLVEGETSFTEEGALSGKSKRHFGNLALFGLTSAEGLKLPQTVNGDLDLFGLTSAEGLKLPQTVNGDLDLFGLTSAEGLKLPQTVNGDLDLFGLTSAEGLKLPRTVNGDLVLRGLTSAKGLKLPETVNGGLDLRGLTSAEGLKFPETVNGNINLSGLRSAKGLKLPETVNGRLYLSGLTSAEGLKFPETVNGGFYLSGLRSAEGLKLPETVNGDLDLRGLTSAKGLKLPETVNGDLDLRGLTSAKDLVLPRVIKGRYFGPEPKR
jgi:hypothetical protein